MILKWIDNDRALNDRLYQIECLCHSSPWTTTVFNSCNGERYFRYFLEHEGKEVGYYVAEQVLDDVTLMNICVHPKSQGKGYGKMLLDHFIEQAEARDANSLWLEVRASNKSAITMYENAGFVETGIRRNYYPAPTGREDAVLMSMSLFVDFSS